MITSYKLCFAILPKPEYCITQKIIPLQSIWLLRKSTLQLEICVRRSEQDSLIK